MNEIENENSEVKFETLAYFSNSAGAGMAFEFLINNGIDAVLQGANFGSLEPLLLPGGFSEIRLMVPESEFERARQLYEAFFESERESLKENEEVGEEIGEETKDGQSVE